MKDTELLMELIRMCPNEPLSICRYDTRPERPFDKKEQELTEMYQVCPYGRQDVEGIEHEVCDLNNAPVGKSWSCLCLTCRKRETMAAAQKLSLKADPSRTISMVSLEGSKLRCLLCPGAKRLGISPGMARD